MRLRPFVVPLSALVVCSGAGCSAPCVPELETALNKVRAALPTFQAAKDATDKVWLEAHGTSSLQGFGVTLVEVDHPPSIEELIPHDVHARGPLDEPSLLFFQKTNDAPSTWPLIGVGYHLPFDPCVPPTLDDEGAALPPSSFVVHEAGWHHVPVGDGSFTAATADDVKPGVTLDAEGCHAVDSDDINDRLPYIKHGRAWTAHVWLPAGGGCPVVDVSDPDPRTDCVQGAGCPLFAGDCEPSLSVQGRAFFAQGDCSAVCAP